MLDGREREIFYFICQESVDVVVFLYVCIVCVCVFKVKKWIYCIWIKYKNSWYVSDSGQFKSIFINNVINYFKIKEQNIWVVEKSYLFCGEIFLFAVFVIIPYISSACVLRFVTIWYRVLDKSWK